MQDHLNPEPRIWNLITRKLSGDITSDQLVELRTWLEQYPEREQFLTELALLWDSAAHRDLDIPTEIMAWKRLEPRLQDDQVSSISLDNREQPPYFKWLAIGAFIIFTAAAAIFWLISDSDPQPSLSESHELIPGSMEIAQENLFTKVKSDSVSHIRLPDGSWVWLNKDSNINFSPSFGINTRELQLSGEAYFEVRNDQRIPFIIKTPHTQTRVLGTSFNLKAYEQSPVELKVVEGTVTFSENNPNTATDTLLVLKAGEDAIWSEDEGRIRKIQRKDDHFLDWKYALEYKLEISSPAEFLSGNWRSKINDLDHTEIEGVIHNHAKLATYHEIKMRVQYYHKKRERMITFDFMVHQSVAPGETIDYQYSLTDESSQMGEIQVKIIDASVNH